MQVGEANRQVTPVGGGSSRLQNWARAWAGAATRIAGGPIVCLRKATSEPWLRRACQAVTCVASPRPKLQSPEGRPTRNGVCGRLGGLCLDAAPWQNTDQTGGTGPNAIPHTREGRGPVVVGSRVTRPLPGQGANGALVLPETGPAAQSPRLGPVAPVTFTGMVVLNARRGVPPHLR